MIHFKKELYEKAIIEIKDYVDVAKDFGDINYILDLPVTVESRKMALQLDIELRKKYSTIDILIDFAERLSQIGVCSTGNKTSTSNGSPEYERLKQDAYGILAHVLIKKAIIKKADEFIDYVD